MSLTHILEMARRLLTEFFREQAEMSEKVELFVVTIPWREEP